MILTNRQKYRLCKYLLDKYAPLGSDGISYKAWEACTHCPLNGKGTCNNTIDTELTKELEDIINGEGFEYIED